MASADFSRQALLHGFRKETKHHVRETSLVKHVVFPSYTHLYPLDLLLAVPSSYWTLTLFAALSLQEALYQVSVRWGRCLPLTSFRFRVATDTLVSLAGRFPLLGLVRDLHPLDNTHDSQTKIRNQMINL